ncbi:MAG: rhodanese-like domain-containing protein [Actinomycetota bacterium]
MTKVLSISFSLLLLAAVFKGCGQTPPQATGEAILADEQTSSQYIEIIDVDQAYEFYTEGKNDYVFIDVRSEGEFESGHIEGAFHIPVSEIGRRLDEIPQDRLIVVYCNGSSCDRSGKAAQILADNGYRPVYDIGGGGIVEWMYKEYPHVRE